jgi:hypothetical protein
VVTRELGGLIVQLVVLLIAYPLWIRKSYGVSFWRWFLMALVVSVSTLVILRLGCYAGLCVGG